MAGDTRVAVGPWRFPPDWILKIEAKPRGTKVPTFLHFETEAGHVFSWTSRRHHRSRRISVPPHLKKPVKFKWYGYKHSIPYWSDLLFLVGFAFLLTAQICKLIFCTHEDYESCSGTAQLITVQIFLFVGNGLFLIGGYFAYVEIVNQHVEPTKRHTHDFYPGLTEPKIKKLYGWRPLEIPFWASIILITGVLFFIFHLTTAQIKWFSHHHVADSVGTWMPAILASSCFVLNQYLGLVELCHSWLPWKPQSWIFWLIVGRLVASLCYLAAAISGLWWNDLVRLWGSKVMFLIGSSIFLVCSYGGILEVLN